MSQRKSRAQRAETAARAESIAALPVPTDSPSPFAHRFATYPGDVTGPLLDSPVVGPNTIGEPLAVVYAHYDPVEDKTRAGFRYATVHDVREQMTRDLAVAMKGGRP